MKHKKLLWVKINRNDFDSLIQDAYNNLNNNELKTTVNKKAHDLKNAKTFLEKITTQKISEENAKELYSNLITLDILELENVKGKDKNKRHKILRVLENLKSVFTGAWLHYKNVPPELEESITERTKLRRQITDEIERKEKNINNKLFKEYFTDDQSPSNMYKKLIETENAEMNQTKVDFIQKAFK